MNSHKAGTMHDTIINLLNCERFAVQNNKELRQAVIESCTKYPDGWKKVNFSALDVVSDTTLYLDGLALHAAQILICSTKDAIKMFKSPNAEMKRIYIMKWKV